MKSQLAIAILLTASLSAPVSGDPIGNGDVNGDGAINIADAIYLMNLQFLGGPEPIPLACEDAGEGTGVEVEFAEAAIFFEFNSTDLDLGIHIFFDAEGWERVTVTGPDGKIFGVDNGGNLRDIGSTEVFTESAEPPLDEDHLEQEMADFLARFPEGEYVFTGRTVAGDDLVGSAMLSHALPAAPVLVFPDEESEENIARPEDAEIVWRDTSEEGDPVIERFQVIVEFEEEETERVFEFVVDVRADPDAETQSIKVPEEFFKSLEGLEGEYKAEVIAIASDKNATISEHEFEVEGDDANDGDDDDDDGGE